MYAARSTNCPTDGKKSKSSPLKMVSRDNEESVIYTRPQIPNLDSLSKATKFSKDQIRTLYRGFKQYCPTGYLTEAILRKIYNLIFPFGDSSMFVAIVFSMLDDQKTGLVTFEQVFRCLSEITKGTDSEKLDWLFKMYDIENKGEVSRQHVAHVVQAVHQLSGRVFREDEVRMQVTTVFQRLGAVRDDDVITLDQFLYNGLQDRDLLTSILAFTNTG